MEKDKRILLSHNRAQGCPPPASDVRKRTGKHQCGRVYRTGCSKIPAPGVRGGVDAGVRDARQTWGGGLGGSRSTYFAVKF